MERVHSEYEDDFPPITENALVEAYKRVRETRRMCRIRKRSMVTLFTKRK